MTFPRAVPSSLAVALLLAACGSSTTSPSASAGTTHHATASPSEAATSSPTFATSIRTGGVVFQSSLQPPTADFGTGANVTQVAEGLALSVTKPQTYTYSEPQDSHPIPLSGFEVHVALDDSQAGNLYFGIACRGLDMSNTYLLLFDAKGDWVIVQVVQNNQRLLQQGTAMLKPGTIHVVDAACVTPSSDDNVNYVSLAIDGKVAGSATDTIRNVPASNVIALFADSHSAGDTGSVTFGSITIRSASA